VVKIKINRNCVYFNGDIPCNPHKKSNVHCDTCNTYSEIKERILIIKLGAIGDVIRSTTLLRKLKALYPKSEITWITHYPEVVPSIVSHIYSCELSNIIPVLCNNYDLLINLDKYKLACGLANLIKARTKKGFKLENGKCAPFDSDAEHKFLTGIFDDVSKANNKSYQQEIFELCGFEFSGEKYILDKRPSQMEFPASKRPLVGLNTGCGKRWKTRLWPEDKWVKLAKRLKNNGYGVLLLGGPEEHDKNLRISELAGVTYLGLVSINDFINLIDECDLIVTAVTMAMHIASGLEKKLVLFVNIFPKDEFELYGLGTILSPPVECKCYYQGECREYGPKGCMDKLEVDQVMKNIETLLDANDS